MISSEGFKFQTVMNQKFFHAANPFFRKIKFFFSWKLVIVYLRESLKAYLPVGTFHIIIDQSKSRSNYFVY